MRKYKTQAIRFADEYYWVVRETTTDQTIRTFYFEDEAKETAKFYDRGGGFDGFTPAFMLVPAKAKFQINQQFEKVFLAP